jgi:hypothetical protein
LNTSGRTTTSRSVVRAIVVIALAAWSVLSALPDIALPWHPFSTFGFYSDADGNITDVYPDHAAAAAGLRVGDRIDLAKTPFESRRYAETVYSSTWAPGTTATFAVVRDGATRDVTLTSSVFNRSLADNASDIALIISQILFVLIGAALVLLRPSIATWAFFIYGVSVGGGSILLGGWLSAQAILAQDVLIAVSTAAGPIAFVFFALRFPRDEVSRLGLVLERALIPVFVLCAAVTVYAAIAPILWARPVDQLARVDLAVQIACYGLGIVAFTATYLASRHDDRARVRWVMLGFGIAFAGQLANIVLFQSPLISWSYPIWVLNVIQLPILFAALSVAYAVIRHRVIDVRFVVSRALVYTALTSVLVAAFVLIDWFIGRVLAQSQLALAAEIVGALVIGLSLDGLHKKVDQGIDRVLFRQRYLAEQRLTRLASALPHAESEKAVGEILIDEVASAFELVSAALFRRGANDAFERQASTGWDDADASSLDVDDPVVLQLVGDSSPLRLHEGRWRRADLPSGSRCPILAIPIVVRHTLAAIALYGAHGSGEDLDPDEIRSILALAVAAGAAYDHINAEAYRRRSEDLSREVDFLRRRLATT